MMIASQIRAARALISWEQTRLSKASGLAIGTIRRMESSDGYVRGIAENVWKVQRALEDAGIEFIDENGGGPGVRLKRKIET